MGQTGEQLPSFSEVDRPSVENLLMQAKDRIDELKFEEAISVITKALEIQADHSVGQFMLGDILRRIGALEDALPLWEGVIQKQPKNIVFWKYYLDLIACFENQAVLDDAISLMQQTFEVSKFCESEMTPLDQLYSQGRYPDLDQCASTRIAQNLRDGLAWRFLGVSLLDQGRDIESFYAMEVSICLSPHDALVHFNMGSLMSKAERLSKAEFHFREAIRLNPSLSAAYNNLGNCLRRQGKLDEAESNLRMMIRLDKDFCIARVNLIGVLREKGETKKAMIEARKAFAQAPNSPEVCNAYGSILFSQELDDEALIYLKRAVELRPNYSEPLNNIGTVLFRQKKYEEAKSYFLSAVSLDPSLGGAYRCLGQISQSPGNDLFAAEKYFRKALKVDPKDSEAYMVLLYMLSQADHVSANDLFLEHLRFGEVQENPWKSQWSIHKNLRDKNRVLKIGFVSGDFYHHAVASFVMPLFQELAKDKNYKMYAYYNNTIHDAITDRIRKCFANWSIIDGKSDQAAYDQIVSDKIDVLIDLSGHTSKNRLTLFARKPAPIQVSWMGYPGTTGLKSIDYFFADHYFLPNGSFDHLFSEKIGNLSTSAPFEPHKDAPEVTELPCQRNGFVTFGSFNRLGKVGAETIALWAEVLNKVPGSRLLIGGVDHGTNLRIHIDRFAAAGIEIDRLEFVEKKSMEDYLALYSRIDLCLDTFPYNGGTTTLHGIWMGVPTVSLAGDSIPSRCSAAILSASGLPQFLAQTKLEYVDIAIHWSSRVNELAVLRQTMREKFLLSPKGNVHALVNSFSNALRFIWARWCDGLEAVAFDTESDSFPGGTSI